ncbi:hypothetical protein J8L88_13220 [Aquimarina sp. MMG015]|uniref:hypothetical protein n=1 Tax=Aquimarina TaxID=290174 RepID=UPI0003F67C2E|nr:MULTISPECIES: hypothetical protein [Aquimarina]MBQ4803817.1 hypothetical protein [Aquimarina sp. MMG015]
MKITNFYGNLLYQTDSYPLIRDHLDKIVNRMLEGMLENQDVIFHEINNYHPDYLGIPIEKLKKLNLTIDDCRTTIANEYGFKNWNEVEKLKDSYDQNFEKAVNLLINGDFTELKRLVTSYPDLVTKTSKYGHKATLLIYTASNGVEMWRQKAPKNLPEITQFLIDRGADIHATIFIYGGYFNTADLLATSSHPFEAGIGAEMMKILKSES